MSKLIIEGGVPLHGTITASGNKNAALPMIAAALLTDEEVILENVPDILDVRGMMAVLESVGASCQFQAGELRLHAPRIGTHEVPREICARLRTSFLVTAALLHRCGRAKLSPPGGDVIGRRRLDAHFYGLRKLGAEIDEDNLSFSAPKGLAGSDMFFDEAGVTATEHLLMAAALAKGKTIIRNAACEPHVQDLVDLLVKMGAQIQGRGNNTLVIEGVAKLHGVRHRVRTDHIEVGSYLALAAATGGDIQINDISRSHYWMMTRVFERMGLELEFSPGKVRLPPGQKPSIRKDVGGMIPCIDDGPWPQFPTDMMSAMIVLATQAEGTVLFFEKMFESRLWWVDGLISMGASAILCDPHRIVVSGRTQLRAGTVRSPDIRAGIALVIAALCAQGTSTVENAQVIDRGYDHLDDKLRSLGARFQRVD